MHFIFSVPLGAVWLSWPHSCLSSWLENKWLGTSKRLCCRKRYIEIWHLSIFISHVFFSNCPLGTIHIFKKINKHIMVPCACVTDFSETGGAAGKGEVIQKVHIVDGSRTTICRTSASLDSSMSIWRWVRFYSVIHVGVIWCSYTKTVNYIIHLDSTTT